MVYQGQKIDAQLEYVLPSAARLLIIDDDWSQWQCK